MAVHGYGRGSLSKAAVEALTRWCTDHAAPPSTISENFPREEETSSEQPIENQALESPESKSQPETPPAVETGQTSPDGSPSIA